MLKQRSFARLACIAVFAVAATGCATQRSADEKAMQRAYEVKVPVTGSRIRRRIDPDTGAPSVGYPTTTIEGESVRMMLRGARAPGNAQD
jgi:hypothetical protein